MFSSASHRRVADDEAFRSGGTTQATARCRRAWPARSAKRSPNRMFATSSRTSRRPTLILHRKDCDFVPVGHGRYLAEHIAVARYVELPGADSLLLGRRDRDRYSTRSRSSSPACAAAPTPNVCSPQLFSPTLSARLERAAALGDDRWHALLDNHDNAVRHELERFRGREVNTVGDGFVAMFTSPSVAIDCADAIVDAVRPLGIEVRVGIHAGEVEVRGDDIAGMAVHIAARVAALAGRARCSCRRRCAKSSPDRGAQFGERGEHELRGVPGRWRVYSLVTRPALRSGSSRGFLARTTA